MTFDIISYIRVAIGYINDTNCYVYVCRNVSECNASIKLRDIGISKLYHNISLGTYVYGKVNSNSTIKINKSLFKILS